MIENLRKQMESSQLTTKKVIALLIFGAIILVFVLFGFQGKHNAIGVGSAARVNNTLISVADLQSETSHMEQMYGQLFGGQMSGEAQRQFLQGQALENLIMNELVYEGAAAMGLRATDNEVRDFVVTEMPVFQKDGRFQRDLYTQILEVNHLTPSDFEKKLRKERVNQRIRQAFSVAVLPVELEASKNQQLQNNQINIGFLRLDAEKLAQSKVITASTVSEQLAQPEFAKKVADNFAANKASYASEEQVHAAHILIKSKAGDAASEKAALAKITDLKKRAAHEDFAALASKYSEDIGSKAKKGDLGFFTREKMVPEFANAAFAQKLGQVGEPVKTPYGYHLIKVIAKKPATVPTLDAFRDSIARKLMASDKLVAFSKSLEEALQKGDQAAVDALLKTWGLTWEQTGFFALGSETVPQLSGHLVSQAVFELNTKKPLLNHLIHEGETAYVLKFNGQKQETAAAVEFKTEQIERERAGESFTRWLEQLKKSGQHRKKSFGSALSAA